jgi:hypothetical protein
MQVLSVSGRQVVSRSTLTGSGLIVLAGGGTGANVLVRSKAAKNGTLGRMSINSNWMPNTNVLARAMVAQRSAGSTQVGLSALHGRP